MKTEKLNQIGSDIGKFGSAAGGLVLGSFGMKLVPKFGPPIVQKITPGLLGMGIASIVGLSMKDEYAKAAALGLGLAGFIDLVKKTIGPSLPSSINDAIPTLSGVSYVQNYGAYPPSYFSQSNASRLQGVGNAYSLMGPSQGSSKRLGNAYSLMGPSQGSSAYALN